MARKLNEAIKRARAPKRQEPLWKGPSGEGPNGGVTQSMIGSWLCCRERFRVKYILGLQSTEGFNHRIEYGSMFHLCEETWSKSSELDDVTEQTFAPLRSYCQELCRTYPNDQEQIIHWMQVCKVQFPIYVDYWANHEETEHRESILQEQVFDVPYSLPSERTVRLRGKWDGVSLVGKGRNRRLSLDEHKTKGDIDEQRLKRQLSSGFDLQLGLYLTALQRAIDSEDPDSSVGEPAVFPLKRVSEVRYNVVRRPLSGGKGTIRQHQPTKSNPSGESKEEFYRRLQGLIREEADAATEEKRDCFFFMRWRIEVSQADVERFRRECLDPILEQMCDWYDYMMACKMRPREGDPFDLPLDPYLRGIHFRFPHGVFNPLTDGSGESDVEEYLNSGSTVGLRRAESLFRELQ